MNNESESSDAENEGLEAAEEEIDEEPEAGLGPGAENGDAEAVEAENGNAGE